MGGPGPPRNEFARQVLGAQQPVIDEADAHMLERHRKAQRRPVVIAVAAVAGGADPWGRRLAKLGSRAGAANLQDSRQIYA